MKRRIAASIAFTLLLATAAVGTELGVRAERFTVDGKPAFLLGISYYGALGAPWRFIEQDLDDMQEHGFNWIRVWANWSGVGALDRDGNPRQPYLTKLRRLVEECDRRGMIVDVTLTTGPWKGKPPERRRAAHMRAVETVTRTLKPLRSWYLDLSNERNTRGAGFVSPEDLRTMRRRAKQICPNLLVTASHWEEIPREAMDDYLSVVEVDFLTPHGNRTAEATKKRAETTKRYRRWTRELGKVVPVHYQEPLRRDFIYRKSRWQPTADDILRDLRGARRGGAAGWCFHNGRNNFAADRRPFRSFDMRDQRLFDQLDDVERQVLRAIRQEFRTNH